MNQEHETESGEEHTSGVTVGELRRMLAAYDEDADIIFGGGGFDFCRVKQRDKKLVQIEFS